MSWDQLELELAGLFSCEPDDFAWAFSCEQTRSRANVTSREWQKDNRDRYLAMVKRWLKNNPDKRREINRRYLKRRHDADPELARARYRAQSAKRSARRRTELGLQPSTHKCGCCGAVGHNRRACPVKVAA